MLSHREGAVPRFFAEWLQKGVAIYSLTYGRMCMCIRSNHLAILVAITVMMVGYGEAEANSSCEPERPYNDCWQVDLSQLQYWQDTLHDPQWRIVEESDHEILDYRVTIDARSLNGGVIPTAPGQGHYASEEDYAQAVEDLLGVPIDATTEVQIHGTTTKMAVECGPVARSTGSFVNDALTDEHGRLIIDGEDRTEDYIRPYVQRWDHQVEGQCQDGLDAGDISTDDQMESTTFEVSGGWSPSPWPFYSLLADGVYEADLWTESGKLAFEFDVSMSWQVGSRIDNVRHYLLPNACILYWDFDAMVLEFQCMVADELYLENKYPEPAYCICRRNQPFCADPWEEGDNNPNYNTTAHEVFVNVPGLSGHCWGVGDPQELMHNHCAEGWADFLKPDVDDYGRVRGLDTNIGFCDWDD